MKPTCDRILFMRTLENLLKHLWEDYIQTNPQSLRIFNVLLSHFQIIYNDHLAFRTYNYPKVALEIIAKPFKNFGYQEKEEYFFKEKKLRAKHYEHRIEALPKIFISELLTEQFSKNLQKQVLKTLDSISEESANLWDFCVSGRTWKISYPIYEALRKESEYAAWMYVFGFRANHFTVAAHKLPALSDLQVLNDFLKKNGFTLNSNGGEIKGSPEVYLEQSSTLANEVPVEFQEGIHSIPACYYEFAKRYPMPNGKLFQGFLEQSANKIFESTDVTTQVV